MVVPTEENEGDDSIRRISSFYDDNESKENFRKVDSSDVLSMISTDGSDLEECLLGT